MNARAIMIAKIATGEIDDAPDPAAKALSKKGGPKAARVEELAGDSVYPATGNAGGSSSRSDRSRIDNPSPPEWNLRAAHG
jgi:hypothetical protein